MSGNYEAELAAAQKLIESEAIKNSGAHFEKQGQLLIAAMQTTQKNLMNTFEQFQSAFKKLAEEMAGIK